MLDELDKKILAVVIEMIHHPDSDQIPVYVAKIKNLVYEQRLEDLKESRKWFNQTINEL